MRTGTLAAVALLALGCAAAVPDARAPAPRAGLHEARSFLQFNTEDVDGTPAYIHFAAHPMPLRVSVETPRQSARSASREETHRAIVRGVERWQEALRGVAADFSIEIVGDDPDADVRIVWKRRMGGDIIGAGQIRWYVVGGQFRVRGEIAFSIQHCPADSCVLTAFDLERLIAHEFGHALGLGHCLDCDSAMNYAWEKREHVMVTASDVKTLLELWQIPNGQRADGSLLSVLLQDPVPGRPDQRSRHDPDY